eukprot:scaffold12300_cov132-Isochrysis_galbana.AAC.10
MPIAMRNLAPNAIPHCPPLAPTWGFPVPRRSMVACAPPVGGATIIPQQGLNRDCTVFFELFHASRESFTYLREFYIGELKPSERSKVPHGDERASDDFMAQLREVSSEFRLRIPSFEDSALQAKAHLGA